MSITAFDELNYFTGVTSLVEDAIRNSSSLRSIGLKNITSVSRRAFYGSGLYYAWLPLVSTLTYSNAAYNGQFSYTRSLIAVRFDAITQMSTIFYNSSIEYMVCTTEAVPTISSSSYFPSKIYVLDSLVSEYEAATEWSSKTILPLSQLETDYPDCPWLDDLKERGIIE